MLTKSIAVVFLCALWLNMAAGADFFIAPGGDDGDDGSLGSPWGSFAHAIDQLSPGDTLLVRGGTYSIDSRIRLQNGDGGVMESPVNIWAYQSEVPILDFSTMSATPGASSGRGIQVDQNVNHLHFRGLTIQNARDNGLHNAGSYNIFERMIFRYNADSGLQLSGAAAHNLIRNSDSYENFDPHNDGENADGFAAKFIDLGPGNLFDGNRAWGNSDDGWDMWEAGNAVEIRNSWAFDNGVDIWGVGGGFAGDGNGFKLGQNSGAHLLANLLAWNNRVRGIDVNGNGTGVSVCNSTVYASGRNWQFDETSSQTQELHALRNNVSYAGSNSDTFLSGVDDSFNSWNGSSVSAADFLSLDDSIARGPRPSDGSLPTSDFLRLLSASDLVDAGIDVGLPFFGQAPDLGAFETVPAGRMGLAVFTIESYTIDDYRQWLLQRQAADSLCSVAVVSGDFNGDGAYDCLDVDALVAQIASGSNGASFDLTGDGMVDGDDLDSWLIEAGAANLPSGNAYLRGDANLDGTVDGQDFLVWNNNKFTSQASWCAGDFNADSTIDGQDFLIWNAAKFTSSDAQPVPEPVCLLPFALCFIRTACRSKAVRGS